MRAAGQQVAALAMMNPLLFVILILGALLFVGLIFGIAILVGLLVIAIIGLFLPAIILIFGLWKLTQGNLKLGLVLVLLAFAIWWVVYSGVVKFA